MKHTRHNEHELYLAAKPSLDLFSTSQKDVLFCIYNAPYFAYETRPSHWTVSQGNCHHWDCPKCGEGRARQEYGRIVEGCRTIEKSNDLYFITITCKGQELSLAEAMEGYGKWTNSLLTALRANAKTRCVAWHYAQVTEQQGRGHPHSHILTTYFPKDLEIGTKPDWKTGSDGKRYNEPKECLRSDYLSRRVISAGLGEQYDISKVDKVEGASRYVAKYLFHPDMFKATYPKNWKRVRYSQSFPKLPDRTSDAIVLLSRENWQLLARKATFIHVSGEQAESEVRYQMRGSDIILRVAPIDKNAI